MDQVGAAKVMNEVEEVDTVSPVEINEKPSR
jgi:hypothetical protein